MNSTPPLPEQIEAMQAQAGQMQADQVPDSQTGMDRSIKLPANCSTASAEDLHVRLVLAADLDGEILIDGSEVENLGQAVLQLLLVARREATAAGLEFSIVHPSSALLERATAYRVADALGLGTKEPVL